MMCLCVVVTGMIVFPSGPFIRPHPVFWRAIFGLGVLYCMQLIFFLFSSKAEARRSLTLVFADLNVKLPEKSYAADCTLSWSVIWDATFDQFFLAHFLGWMVKYLMIRDQLMCWLMSILWELIEMAFTHMLPNFAECWWDQWLLDVLLANGLGIYCGKLLVDYFECREYDWSSQNLKGMWDYMRRGILQFTPASLSNMQWGKTQTFRRLFACHVIVIMNCLCDLNAFFLKTLLWVPPPCYLNLFRLILMALIGAPCIRQVYIYTTDSNCKRLGAYAFMGLLSTALELLVILKMAPGEFPVPMPDAVKTGLWVALAVYLLLMAIVCFRIRRNKRKKQA
jgi:phosphatidylserine synthase 2